MITVPFFILTSLVNELCGEDVVYCFKKSSDALRIFVKKYGHLRSNSINLLHTFNHNFAPLVKILHGKGRRESSRSS